MLNRAFKLVFLLSALVSVAAIILIIVFIFIEGSPAIAQIGLGNFIFGAKWNPGLVEGLPIEAVREYYGILPMILSSLLSSIIAVILGTIIGIMTAVFLAYIAPEKMRSFIISAVNLMASVPSVVVGFFGMTIITGFIYNTFGTDHNLVDGFNLTAGCAVLTIMILPTIISISDDAIRSVSHEQYDGSMALGASKLQSLFKVIIPAASPGILAGVMLGIGRAIGETMAITMVIGNSVRFPFNPLQSVRTLTGNIAFEMGYTEQGGLHQQALFATGIVLLVFIMIINISIRLILTRQNKKK